MDPAGDGSLRHDLDEGLWPLVERVVATGNVAGLAVAVVRDDEDVTRGFGVRDVRSGAPVTPQTMFHLASVSKPFVATAIVSLATTRGDGDPVLDLDAPIGVWVPELTLADGREQEVTARGLLSHTSGLPDVVDFGWHAPQLGDDALSDFARSLSGWRLTSDPGSTFSYSNAGYELLGLVLSRVLGSTFEDAVRRQALAPVGMTASTFLRAEVPDDRASSPHVGMPLVVPEGAYPYTRRHAPSSSLHADAAELSRWMRTVLSPAGPSDEHHPIGPDLLERMSRPVISLGEPPWEEDAALGWFVGSYRGLRTLSHSGADPGFGSRLVLVPELRTGVVVLANSNTVPTSDIASTALDVALRAPASGGALRAMLPPVVGPVAEALGAAGPVEAEATFQRLATAEPATHDLDDEELTKAVWGAIELHRTDLVWPLLRVWTAVRPDSSEAWTMTGWAHQVDGEPDLARRLLRRALELDPGNDDAALILSGVPPT